MYKIPFIHIASPYFIIHLPLLFFNGLFYLSFTIGVSIREGLLINSEYTKSMLDNFCFVLNVSNIQNANPMSLVQLQKMLSSLSGQYFIFEYTTRDRKTDNLWQIAKLFENVADIDIYEINELPIEYALTIVKPTNLSKIDELENFYKDIAKGNLYKLYIINNHYPQLKHNKIIHKAVI